MLKIMKYKLLFLIFFSYSLVANAGKPLWTFEALTPTIIELPANQDAVIEYRIQNLSAKNKSLV